MSWEVLLLWYLLGSACAFVAGLSLGEWLTRKRYEEEP